MFNQEKIEKLTEQLEINNRHQAEVIVLLRVMLKKQEEQNTMLGSIGRFCKENSAGTAAFGRTR